MGLLFKSRRRSGNGVTTLLMIVGGIALASPWLVRNQEGIHTSCTNKMQRIGGVGNALCDAIGRGIAMLDVGIGGVGESLSARWEEKRNDWSVSVDNSNIRDRLRGTKAQFEERLSTTLSSYVSGDAVQSLIAGGGMPSIGSNPSGQLRGALSSLVAGQKLLQGGGGIAANPDAALDVYKQGAGLGAYGLMPQLELGSLYSRGGFGVEPDFGQANLYNSQALESLKALRSSNTPEAQSMLQGLNIDPAVLQMQLEELMASIKQGN